jgi:hypothetical protein
MSISPDPPCAVSSTAVVAGVIADRLDDDINDLHAHRLDVAQTRQPSRQQFRRVFEDPRGQRDRTVRCVGLWSYPPAWR